MLPATTRHNDLRHLDSDLTDLKCFIFDGEKGKRGKEKVETKRFVHVNAPDIEIHHVSYASEKKRNV